MQGVDVRQREALCEVWGDAAEVPPPPPAAQKASFPGTPLPSPGGGGGEHPGGEEIAPTITIDDFTKIDLRIAKIVD